MPNRIQRLREYEAMKGPAGESYSKKNLAYWAERATENSKIAPRAKRGEVELPNTNVSLHDTAAPPRRNANVDARMVAKSDLNFVGSSPFMRNVRRTTS